MDIHEYNVLSKDKKNCKKTKYTQEISSALWTKVYCPLYKHKSFHISMPTPRSFVRELHISMPNYRTLCFYTKLWNIRDYMPNHRALVFPLDY
jgi:hypothetical protein